MLLSVPTPVAADDEGIVIENAEAQDSSAGTVIVVSGTAPLPNGAEVSASLLLEGLAGAHAGGTVTKDRFSVEIGPIERSLLPGSYTLRVSFERRRQTKRVVQAMGSVADPAAVEHSLRLGTKDQETAERALLATRYSELYEQARIAYLNVVTLGSYYSEGARPGSEGLWKEAADEWAARQENLKLGPLARLGRGLSVIRDEVFLGYFPDAHGGLENLGYLLPKLAAAYGVKAYRASGQEPPEDLAAQAQFGPKELREQVGTRVREIEKSLGLPRGDWQPVNLELRERGKTEGNRYVSLTSKFAVARPDETWSIQEGSTNPVTRLVMKPEAEERAALGWLHVEILEQPRSESDDDLVRLTKIQARDRWPAFKEVSARRVKVDDDSMPGGKRPGFELIFHSTLEGREFKVREYHLFCRFKKRTYALISMTVKEQFDDFAEEFQRSVDSFAVLDGDVPIMERSAGDSEGN